jgi:hypothetical protein
MKLRLKHFAVNVAKLTLQLPDTLANRFIKAKLSDQVLRPQPITVLRNGQNQEQTSSTKGKLLKRNWTRHYSFWKCLKSLIRKILLK